MTNPTFGETIVKTAAAWGVVASMALCVAVLIASEFMPVSLLTPIALDLGMSEGEAGQAISISGLFAVLTSLFIAGFTRKIDRKFVLSSFSLMLIVSGLVVSFAPNYTALMVGRALLGVAIGGFWSMSTAVVMRLLPESAVPEGLAMLNAGNAIAATISAPLGSFLGDYIGWRGAFFFVVPLALIALIGQWTNMPSLPPRNRQATGNVFRLLARRQVALGMTAILLLFMGQFALFTYLRPFLESAAGFSVSGLSLVLLLMGLAGVGGTWCISRLLVTRLYSIVIAIPLVMAAIALTLIAVGSIKLPVAALLIAWGFFGTAAPVGWGTWLSRVLHDDAEAGGGLQVAVIQFAITIGAAAGGLLFDWAGWWSSFAFAAALLLGSSVAAWAASFEWEHSK
ncbi:MFS transporter (plasmid) [Sinorhizobium meliloti WSM1022]|uniref:MFS transporter n=1 Tax=Rhizobium meliloti TaxID=382 RepID=UPI00040D5ADC|nr:MFS transporter [Sinorhizobium meliloti]QKN18369.1 MFS transporter [Sinorhizobium meliloti WSM1022]RVG16737.1 MFS transporter [Sinorhizobium meliloti]RVG36052.1 MFS transporter [Sinorhizobium meliloti]